MKYLSRLGLAAVVFGLTAGTAAHATNITIADGVAGGNFGGGAYGPGGEDNEVEAGAVQSQNWDLEGFDLNGTALTLWGGFDFINGEGQGSSHWGGGDIFIDVNGDAVWGAGISRDTSNAYYKYDYVISFDRTGDTLNGTYDVFAIGDGANVLQTYNWSGDKFDWSNPYQLDRATGQYSEVTGFQDVAYSYLDFASAGNPLGFAGAEHNALTVDLGFLSSDELQGALIHYTMECGNDGMKGLVPSVPDGGVTLCLLGSAVGALGLMRRRLV